ncbi:mevalonate kinase-like isoform X1 [Cucurbita moschata]|uniref:Mevalonate kinase n=1 Tax=Cucurbita moschata TaxID=3662 RepID=A0A6J1FP94_CUCMO|nr:mevalonate kinase-like isoform X1 [Cucurbita moschata]
MEVRARAPGKIILSGEHAVVHGSMAVAASISLYTSVSLAFHSHSDNDDTLKLQLKDMALEFSWPVGRIKEAVAGFNTAISSSSPTSCPAECLKSIGALVEEQNIPEAKIGLASGVSAFLWLYSCIQGFKPATVVVTSELPLGSGLGSSAAFCVALSAALLALSDSVVVDMVHQGWSSFGEKELDLLNKWAFQGEKIIHGKPSGIDNTVSTYGNTIKFKSGSLTLMKSNLPLRMLITNTKEGRNTKALVASVSERTIRHHDALNFIFNAVDSISKELSGIIESPVSGELSISEKEENIAELMEMNQGLLQSMGVSHASIETVQRTTLKYKLASKLTGAGGGGCVLTLLPTSLSGTIVDMVISELESCGFQCLIAGIGGGGVEISFDASP